MSAARDRMEEHYRAQSHRMWRALLAFTGDPDIASDAVAEAFTRAIKEGDRIRDLAAWTWRVSFRIASAELRRRDRPYPSTHSDPLMLPDPVPEVVEALRRLSPNQRLAVVLHDYADRPTAEIAAILGSSRATVHVHLSKGRRRLRALLEEHDA